MVKEKEKGCKFAILNNNQKKYNLTMKNFIFILFLCFTQVVDAHNCTEQKLCFVCDSTSENEISEDTIPVVLFNEKEISYETYRQIPKEFIGSCWFLSKKESVALIGEKGKNGIITAYTKKDYEPASFMFDEDDYYFPEEELEIPAEFPGGMDSLRNYVKPYAKLPKELNNTWINAVVRCYIGRDGSCENAEIASIRFGYPDRIEIFFLHGKMVLSDMIPKKYHKHLYYVREKATEIAKSLPRFIPARCLLTNIKSMKTIRIMFPGDIPGLPKYIY